MNYLARLGHFNPSVLSLLLAYFMPWALHAPFGTRQLVLTADFLAGAWKIKVTTKVTAKIQFEFPWSKLGIFENPLWFSWVKTCFF